MYDCNIWSEINEWHVCNECFAASALFEELLPEIVSNTIFRYKVEEWEYYDHCQSFRFLWLEETAAAHSVVCLAYADPFLAVKRLLVNKGYSKLTHGSSMIYSRNQGNLQIWRPGEAISLLQNTALWNAPCSRDDTAVTFYSGSIMHSM